MDPGSPAWICVGHSTDRPWICSLCWGWTLVLERSMLLGCCMQKQGDSERGTSRQIVVLTTKNYLIRVSNSMWFPRKHISKLPVKLQILFLAVSRQWLCCRRHSDSMKPLREASGVPKHHCIFWISSYSCIKRLERIDPQKKKLPNQQLKKAEDLSLFS